MKTELALSLSMSIVVVVVLIQIRLGPAEIERLLLYAVLLAGCANLIALKLHAPRSGRLLTFLQCGGLIAAAIIIKLSPVAIILSGAAALTLACHCLDLRGKQKAFLSPEQQLIIYLVAELDKTNREIGFVIDREEGSIGRKLYVIYRKLGVDSRSGLMHWYHAHPVQNVRIRFVGTRLLRKYRTGKSMA